MNRHATGLDRLRMIPAAIIGWYCYHLVDEAAYEHLGHSWLVPAGAAVIGLALYFGTRVFGFTRSSYFRSKTTHEEGTRRKISLSCAPHRVIYLILAAWTYCRAKDSSAFLGMLVWIGIPFVICGSLAFFGIFDIISFSKEILATSPQTLRLILRYITSFMDIMAGSMFVLSIYKCNTDRNLSGTIRLAITSLTLLIYALALDSVFLTPFSA